MASQRPVRIGILGLGFMGSTHAKALRDVAGAELTAVYSEDPEKLAGDLTSVRGNIGAGGELMDFSNVTRHQDLRSVFADPQIDAVDICLPTDLHEVVAMEALRAGKHVLVEKPMGLDGFDVDRMVGAATRTGRILMAAHVLRFWPAYIALRREVAPERYGQVRAATFRRRCAAPAWGGWLLDRARSGGGVFDLLIHDVDMCLHLFGKPEAVSATGYTSAEAGIDVMDADLFYPNGAIVSITGGWQHAGAFPFSMEYSVTLDGATIEYQSANGHPRLYAPGRPEQKLDGGSRDPYAAEIEHFAESCGTGRAPQLCPPRESADAVKLMLVLLEARGRAGRKLVCRI